MDKLDKMKWEKVAEELEQVRGIERDKVKRIGEWVHVEKVGGYRQVVASLKNLLKDLPRSEHVLNEITLLGEYCEAMNISDHI